jgi:hypothetical protein
MKPGNLIFMGQALSSMKNENKKHDFHGCHLSVTGSGRGITG